MILEQVPEWILINSREQTPQALMPGVDLARQVDEQDEGEIDLFEIPARRLQLSGISIQATLQEALERLETSGAEALFVERINRHRVNVIEGILTREQIESAYRF